MAAVRAAARDTVARGAIGNVALNVAATGLNLAATIVLTNALGVRGYGTYATAFAIAMTLSVPAMLGLAGLITRDVARYHVTSEWGLLRGILRHSHATVLVSSLVTALLAAAVGALALTGRHELLNPFLISLAIVPLISLTTMRQSVMAGLGRVLIGRVPENLLAPAAFLALCAGGWLVLGSRFSATVAMAFQVAAGVGAFAVGVVLLRRTLPSQARTAMPEYDRRAWNISGAWLFALSISTILSDQLGVILLGVLKGDAASAGVYQASSRAALFVSFLFMTARYAVSPQIARLHAAHDHHEAQALLSRSVLVLFACCLPVALAFIAFAPQLLAIFGSDFRGGASVLRILSLGEVVRVATGFAGVALVVGGFERDLTAVALAGLVLNAGLSVALIPGLGGEGAAIAYVVSLTVAQVAPVVLVWRRMSLSTAIVRLPLGRRATRAPGDGGFT